jgi:hypothetical protein
MNKSLLTIGIILSLGTVGCAGFGVQHNSSLTAQYRAERGVDDLWAEQEPVYSSAEAPLYAEQELGDLWEARQSQPATVLDPGYDRERGGDLWNPASVTRSWEQAPSRQSEGYRFSQTSGRLSY